MIVFATIRGRTPATYIVLAMRFLSRTIVAIVIATIVCAASVRLTVNSTVEYSVVTGITAVILAVIVSATSCGLEVQRPVIMVFFVAETHEFADVVHACCFKFMTSAQKCIAMWLEKGTKDPFP